MIKTAIEYPEGKMSSTFNLKEAVACLEKESKYTIDGAEIHRGSYGRVYGLCQVREGKCVRKKKVVKIILFEPGPYEKQQVDDLQRELYIFRLLNDSGLTPRVYAEFGCGNYFNVVLDRLGLNMTVVGIQQSIGNQDVIRNQTKVPPMMKWDSNTSPLFSEMQMRRMFEIARDLGQKYGVIHGDLNTNQYLESQDTSRIVVTDFGFSGTSTVEPSKWHAKWGWHWYSDCSAIFGAIPPLDYDGSKKIQKLYQDHFNVWQLWFYFSLLPRPVFVLSKDGSTLSMFPHHREFPASSAFYVPPEASRLFLQQAKCSNRRVPIRTSPIGEVLTSQLPQWS